MVMKEIHELFEIRDSALIYKRENTMILADIHLGIENYLNEQGFLLPPFNYKDVTERLKKIFEKKNDFDRIIINGDFKHEFGRLAYTDWRDATDLLRMFKGHCKEIIMIKGNHDSALNALAEKERVTIKDYYLFEKDKILIVHGHKIPEKELLGKAEIIIIGHEHPKITLKEGPKRETYKCFLKGRFRGKTLIVLPSFISLIGNRDPLEEETLSPFLKRGIQGFEAWAVEDSEIFYFGAIDNSRS